MLNIRYRVSGFREEASVFWNADDSDEVNKRIVLFKGIVTTHSYRELFLI